MLILRLLFLLWFLVTPLIAQTSSRQGTDSSARHNHGTMLLTIFLRHDQSKTLDEMTHT